MAVRSLRNVVLLVAICGASAGCLPSVSAVGAGPGPSVPAESNSAPVISGTPPTQVTAGSSYVFQPSASDNDGDSLRFSASGLPTWASIDPQTGRVQGTPGDAHMGTTAGIVVRVSDGSVSSSLPSFSITVMAPTPTPAPVPPTGTASLSWTVPTQFTDGSPLGTDQLLGYRIYHGTSAVSLSQYHDIDGAGTTTYEARQLAPGDHCFAVTAISVSNVESALSGVGCKRI